MWKAIIGMSLQAIKMLYQLISCPHFCSARRYAPDSIRGKFALSDTCNSVHGANSDESVTKEIEFIFPEFDIQEWMDNEEQCFRNGNVEYFSELGIHKCINNAH